MIRPGENGAEICDLNIFFKKDVGGWIGQHFPELLRVFEISCCC
jgi:hypothetical protein